MATLITDPLLEARLLAERRAAGADRYDEVWEGVYRMAPMPNNEHQEIVGRWMHVLQELLGPGGGIVLPGANVSDREHDWQQNYRVPDVAVFLPETTARDCGTHWLGGPDFLVEVLSRDDQTREKLPFYEKLGVGELLLIDREPWSLELHQLQGSELACEGRLIVADEGELRSAVLPLAFSLTPGAARLRVKATHTAAGHAWLI